MRKMFSIYSGRIRKAKKSFFLVVGPLRGGGGEKVRPLVVGPLKKELFCGFPH